MPTIVNPLIITSKEELKFRLKEILETQQKNSIVGIRGLRLSEEEQLQLARDLGDIAGWYPNNSESFNHKYVENHSSNNSINNSDNDQIILDWHLERVDYDDYIPIIAGVWNMRIFKSNKESGKTYFIDSRKIFNKIYSNDEKNFLRLCKATWTEKNNNSTYENYVDIVQKHWLSGEEQIRISLHHLSDTELYLLDKNPPSSEEKIKFLELIKRFKAEVDNNEELRIVHKWEEGDILLPDLFCLAHAVTGGFDSKDREFTGFWCYKSSPDFSIEEKIPPSWAK